MATASAAQKPPLGQKMPWAGLRLKNRPLSRRMHREKCRPLVRLASGAPVFANGAVTAAMSYAFGSLASRGGSEGGSGFHDPTDAEMTAYLEGSGFWDPENMLAHCRACQTHDLMNDLHRQGLISTEELRDWQLDYSKNGLLAASLGTGAVGAIRGGPMLGRYLFGKGGALNSNRYFRVGVGREGGQSTFRVAGQSLGRVPEPARRFFGIKEIKPGVYKWDLWGRGAL